MKQYVYRVVIEPAEEGGYNVSVPALPGCVTQGETYEEAVAMAKECIEGFIEALVKVGEPVPVDAHPNQPRTVELPVNVAVPAGAACPPSGPGRW